MRPTHLVPLAGATFALFLLPTLAQPPVPPRPAKLPLTRVVLFNSGVGYFHREGTLEGNARVELKVDAEDVNDLIKSLIASDRDGGTVRAVTYDNRAPAEVTLKAFAIDLTENPSVGQLLHQVRGEKVEITEKSGAVLAGSIVSIDRPSPQVIPPAPSAEGQPAGKPVVLKPPSDAVEEILLLTPDGLQTVPLKAAKKIKLLKPELQAEFLKALEALAAARGEARKQVGVEFAGNGPRRVSVGYVTEAPVWKPSYRLTLDGPGTGRFQGWAAVENTTDEDWENVKVALVSGRPMTFRMDLYDPLFVPRPLVEPEVYASLRPPIYQAGQAPGGPPMGAFGALGALGQQGQQGFGGGIGGGILGAQGGLGMFGNVGGQYGNLGGQFGLQGTGFPLGLTRPTVRSLLQNKLSYEEYAKRGVPDDVFEILPKKSNSPSTVPSAALAASLGEPFEYAVPDPVNLPRFKSALLPVANAAVDATRVSIYNPAVLERYPLAGVKFVNKTGQHLAAGPLAVYDGETFAGDARIPSLKPNDTRLVSFAVDLHITARHELFGPTETVDSIKLGFASIRTETTNRRKTTYALRNSDQAPRTILVEHAADDGWSIVGDVKPAERTRSFARFDVTIKANETQTLVVSEERKDVTFVALEDATGAQLEHWLGMVVTTPAAKAAAERTKADRAAIAGFAKTILEEQSALKSIVDEQSRIRANIERVPRDSDAYKRYLKKFDDQETEIEKRQTKVKEVLAELDVRKKSFGEYLKTLKSE